MGNEVFCDIEENVRKTSINVYYGERGVFKIYLLFGPHPQDHQGGEVIPKNHCVILLREKLHTVEIRFEIKEELYSVIK